MLPDSRQNGSPNQQIVSLAIHFRVLHGVSLFFELSHVCVMSAPYRDHIDSDVAIVDGTSFQYGVMHRAALWLIQNASISIFSLFSMENCDEEMWIRTLDFAVDLSLGLHTLCLPNLPLRLQWQPVAQVLSLSKRSCAIVKSLLAQNSTAWC